jgi:general secretion pathway protein G
MRCEQRGFCLIEIMIVLALIGLIASAVGYVAYRHFRDGQDTAARLQVGEVLKTVERYTLNKGTCPTLDTLVAENYLRRPPVDPWGTALELRCPGDHEKDPADVISLGRDRKKGTEDDIKSWDQ